MRGLAEKASLEVTFLGQRLRGGSGVVTERALCDGSVTPVLRRADEPRAASGHPPCPLFAPRARPDRLRCRRRRKTDWGVNLAVDVNKVTELDVEPGTLPGTMAAWVIRQDREGEPRDAFQLEEIEVPEPGAFEVVVRVMAAGVNYNNVWAALGQPVSVFRYHPDEDHHIGGSDASGVVWHRMEDRRGRHPLAARRRGRDPLQPGLLRGP